MYALCTPSICVFIMFKYRLSVKSSLVDILVFKAMGFFFYFFFLIFFFIFSHFLRGVVIVIAETAKELEMNTVNLEDFL